MTDVDAAGALKFDKSLIDHTISLADVHIVRQCICVLALVLVEAKPP